MTDIAHARPSSTVILLRDGADGPEVFLGRRPAKAAFGSAYVFPGGVVDAGDGEHEEHSGVGAADANTVLSLSDGGLAYFVAAVRETFEETGVRLRCDELHYCAFWITPEAMAKRFTTRFFAAKLPYAQSAVHCGVELLDSIWVTANDAIREYNADRLTLAPPTIQTIQSIAHCRSPSEVLAWADAKADAGIEAIQPREPPPGAVI